MSVYLHTKFQVSSIILTSIRQWAGGGGGFILLPPYQNGPLKRPARLWLTMNPNHFLPLVNKPSTTIIP